MRIKRLVALSLVGVMATGLVGCGGKDSSTGKSGKKSDKLVVWTLAADLETFADYYKEKTGKEVEVTVIKPEDYPTKVGTALDGGDKSVDIIVGEPQMLKSFYDKGYFADLDALGAKDYEGKIVDYVWKVGQSSDGVQRAISYQITPAGFYYRRDIAQKVFGTEDPVEIGKLFESYDKILETAETLKKAGYKIFASDAETSYFSGDEPWVVDGKLNVSQARKDYMDLCIKLYQNDYTAFAAQWSAPWLQGMSGELPMLTADTMWGTDDMNIWDSEDFAEKTKDFAKTEVFAYGLPAWGVLTMRDNVKETAGKWGVCAGPASGFGGGTFIGISALSQKQKEAWDFIQFCTLNEETADWWIEKSQGDTVSLISALNKHAEDENATYGGQKLYKFWLEQAEKIDYSKVTEYDKLIGDAWGTAIGAIKTKEKTKEEALDEFYKQVASDYPDLVIEK
ncbi:MAG: carbohydrate ABC transporter substrate-binding protein [Lachnospiraceae bacterium]|nr:carbohydrate ABC transporter substrate-binding protein [Lachnospiraceae bacterium]